MWSRTLLSIGVILGVVCVSACAWVPHDDPPPAVPPPAAASEAASGAPTSGNPVRTTRPPTAPATSATAFPEGYAVTCAGRPTADQVIAVVRRQDSLLPAGSSVTVTTGPLCAGTWQYTVLQVPGHEPLQVVTKGQPAALTFVTAGTNVCTVDVRANAPYGLQSAAAC